MHDANVLTEELPVVPVPAVNVHYILVGSPRHGNHDSGKLTIVISRNRIVCNLLVSYCYDDIAEPCVHMLAAQ